MKTTPLHQHYHLAVDVCVSRVEAPDAETDTLHIIDALVAHPEILRKTIGGWIAWEVAFLIGGEPGELSAMLGVPAASEDFMRLWSGLDLPERLRFYLRYLGRLEEQHDDDDSAYLLHESVRNRFEVTPILGEVTLTSVMEPAAD